MCSGGEVVSDGLGVELASGSCNFVYLDCFVSFLNYLESIDGGLLRFLRFVSLKRCFGFVPL